MTDTETETTTKQDTDTTYPLHLVKLDKAGQPLDKALCGYLWDRINVQHNGNICQECVDISKKGKL